MMETQRTAACDDDGKLPRRLDMDIFSLSLLRYLEIWASLWQGRSTPQTK